MSSIVVKYDRLWDIECGACLRVLEGHEELVRCIRFDNKRIVSGAYDGSVMHTHTRTHLFVLSDIWHVYFTRLSLVPVCSKIKVWDLQAALDPRAPASTLCLRTLVVRHAAVVLGFVFLIDMKSDTVTSWTFGQSEPWSGCALPQWCTCSYCFLSSQEHSGRVFRLQFDEFQIISSSHDDTILIWDFLNVSTNGQPEGRSPSRTYTYISR